MEEEEKTEKPITETEETEIFDFMDDGYTISGDSTDYYDMGYW